MYFKFCFSFADFSTAAATPCCWQGTLCTFVSTLYSKAEDSAVPLVTHLAGHHG